MAQPKPLLFVRDWTPGHTLAWIVEGGCQKLVAKESAEPSPYAHTYATNCIVPEVKFKAIPCYDPATMQFNYELHDLQEKIFAGELIEPETDTIPEGEEVRLRPWPKDKRTEPYEL